MPRGTASLKESENLYLARMMDVRTTTTCAHCDWQLEGWLATVQEAFKAHRLEQHPEIQPRVRRPRTRAHTIIRSASQTSLEDNIANARAKGGATWAGPE